MFESTQAEWRHMAARQTGYHPAMIERREQSDGLPLSTSLLSILGLSILCWGMIGGSLFMAFH